MAEEFRKLKFASDISLAEAIGVSQLKSSPIEAEARLQPDGAMVGVDKTKKLQLQDQEPMEDILNSFVDMCDEERHALVQLMDHAELTLHINAARAHPDCRNYEKYVAVELLGKAWDEDGDNSWRIGSEGEGRAMHEEVFGWYDFLQKKNMRFPPGFSLDISSVQRSHADYLNNFVQMGEEKRRELLRAMDESELFPVHIKAAKAHPQCKMYENYVIEQYGAEDDYVLGAPEGDMLEDALGWYQFLEETKRTFPPDFSEAAVP